MRVFLWISLHFAMLFASMQHATATEPDYPVETEIAYLQESDAAIRSGRFTQAKVLLEWLDKHAGAELRDDIALLHAELFLSQGRTSEASAAAALIKDHNRNACRQNGVNGWIASQMGETNLAILKLAEATKQCPDNIGAWNLLGMAFGENQEHFAARFAFQQALESLPDNPGLMNNLALTYIRTGDLSMAATILERALTIDPQNPAILANFDFAQALNGKQPMRRTYDTEQMWAERLLHAAEGAKFAEKRLLATSMFSQAVLLLDHFEGQAWKLAVKENREP